MNTANGSRASASWWYIAALLFMAWTSPAQAQTCPERPDYLILAMLTVHEAGWTHDDDMRGIHAVITTLARNWGVSYAQAACRHSRRLLTGRTSRVWASELTEDPAVAPAHWPTTIMRREGDIVRVLPHPPWENYQDRWRGRLDLAARVLVERPVTREALTWGGRIDFDPERRRRPLSGDRIWVEIDVGNTLNHFGYWTEAPDDEAVEEPAEPEPPSDTAPAVGALVPEVAESE
jgi:hypothetical protein